jgi:hypothetical protein
LDNRGKILSALYTVLIANTRLRQPRADRPAAKTRFKTWWHLVGSSIEQAALTLSTEHVTNPPEQDRHIATTVDFSALFAELEDEDPEAEGVADLLELLRAEWIGTFEATDIARLIDNPIEKQYPLRAAMMAFLDPTGKRGADVTTQFIGQRLKSIIGAPVYVGSQTMMLCRVNPLNCSKRSARYQVKVGIPEVQPRNTREAA